MWTRGGFTIVHERLEEGLFTFPERVAAGGECVEMDTHELAMLLEGLTRDTARGAVYRHAASRRASNGLAKSVPST